MDCCKYGGCTNAMEIFIIGQLSAFCKNWLVVDMGVDNEFLCIWVVVNFMQKGV